jgi:hypothetical protein
MLEEPWDCCFTIAGLVLTAYGVRLQRSESKTGEALVRCEENLNQCQSSCNVWIMGLLALVVVAFMVGRCSRVA